MQPICLLLPVGSDIAVRLWSVLELGFEARAFQQFPHSRARLRGQLPATLRALPTEAPDHLCILASLFRAHLFGLHRCHGGLWLERRELADLLRLLECGLSGLALRGSHSESIALTLESVSTFLVGIRAQMGALRKPAQRQTALNARAASVAEG